MAPCLVRMQGVSVAYNKDTSPDKLNLGGLQLDCAST
jgi:hypothetical protein